MIHTPFCRGCLTPLKNNPSSLCPSSYTFCWWFLTNQCHLHWLSRLRLRPNLSRGPSCPESRIWKSDENDSELDWKIGFERHRAEERRTRRNRRECEEVRGVSHQSLRALEDGDCVLSGAYWLLVQTCRRLPQVNRFRHELRCEVFTPIRGPRVAQSKPLVKDYHPQFKFRLLVGVCIECSTHALPFLSSVLIQNK
jgi:hypothetical protein